MKPFSRRRFLRAAAASIAAGGVTCAATRKVPNVVLIIADDLGYADLGCYGNPVIQSPNIDRIAKEGMRFTDFHVSWPACTPSRGSILTGRYPQRNGLYDMIRNNEVNWKYQFDEVTYATSPEAILGLDTREVTIGQAMKKAGYSTALIGKWDSGRAKRYLPTQRGFDAFYGFANTGIDYYTHERYGVASMFRNNERITEGGHTTELFRREALQFIDKNASRPFFLYLAFNAPHIASTFDKSAQQVPSSYLQEYGGGPYSRKLEYKALVTQMDDAVGALMAKLKEHGLDDSTLVLFLSDNGGESAGNNGSLRGSKAQVFEGGLRVPLIARWPKHIPANTTNNDFATTMELFPTLLALTGQKREAYPKLDGISMLPALEGKGHVGRTECYWERLTDKAARIGDWKWVVTKDGEGLYDLSTDISEKNDLSKVKPDVLATVRSKWHAWKREMDASEPRGPFRDY